MTTEFNTAQIGNAFGSPGLKMTGEFIQKVLKVEPHRTDKRAMFWTEAQFEQIRMRLLEHIENAPPDPEQWIDLGEKKPPAKKAKKAPSTKNDIDDDDDDDL
jgi:hypothetical protein